MSVPPLFLLSEQKQSLALSSLPTPAALWKDRDRDLERDSGKIEDSDRKEEIGTRSTEKWKEVHRQILRGARDTQKHGGRQMGGFW